MFIMVFGGNLGEWCKWGTCNELNERKGPIFSVKRDQNDEKSKNKSRNDGKMRMKEDDEADGDAVDPGVDDVRNRRKRRSMLPMSCLENDLNGSSRRHAPCKKKQGARRWVVGCKPGSLFLESPSAPPRSG